MTEPGTSSAARLRQVAMVVADLDRSVTTVRTDLGLGEPFADPGVAEFGLRNAVFAVGDTFVEFVSPARQGTAAGRQRDRMGGDGGYMVIVQVPDTAKARRAASELGVRVVWTADLPDISGTHFHPADTGGALLSVDTPSPPESWRWAGPDWDRRAGNGSLAGLTGATVACTDPVATSRRWATLIGGSAEECDAGWCLPLSGSRLSFVGRGSGPEGLVGIEIAVISGVQSSTTIGGCPVDLVPVDPPGPDLPGPASASGA